jgi:hypothetical protein
VDNEEVKSMLGNGGENRLPFIFINDRLWLQGRYITFPPQSKVEDNANGAKRSS